MITQIMFELSADITKRDTQGCNSLTVEINRHAFGPNQVVNVRWDDRKINGAGCGNQHTLFTFSCLSNKCWKLDKFFWGKWWQLTFAKQSATQSLASDGNSCYHASAFGCCFTMENFFLLLNLVPDDHSKLFSVGPLHVVLSWQKLLSEEQKPGCTENVSLTARCRSLVQPRVCC